MIKIITEHFPNHCSGVVIIYIPSPHYPILERAINRGILVPHSFISYRQFLQLGLLKSLLNNQVKRFREFCVK